jgi:RNA polymerase sigma-70 factor (ECF subfamily)
VNRDAQALESTRTLLLRVQGGDAAARDELFVRFIPGLRRWAHGRLPASRRDLSETDDLVQNTLLRALGRIDEFDPRRPGAFLAYLHTILLNSIREEARRGARRSSQVVPLAELPESGANALPETRTAVLERSLGQDAIHLYERALPRLTELQQQAVVLRIEFGFSHEEIASALRRPSPDAARMIVARGVERLAELMHEAGD